VSGKERKRKKKVERPRAYRPERPGHFSGRRGIRYRIFECRREGGKRRKKFSQETVMSLRHTLDRGRPVSY